MNNFMGELGRLSWQGGVLIVILLLLQKILGFRLHPKWRSALWFLVVLRLLMPFSVPTRWSVFNVLPKVERSSPVPPHITIRPTPYPPAPRVSYMIAGNQAIPIRVPPQPKSDRRRLARNYSFSVNSMPAQEFQPGPPIDTSWIPPDWPREVITRETSNWLFYVWLSGAVTALAGVAVVSARFARKARRLPRLDDPYLRSILAEAAAALKLRRVPEMILNPEIKSPGVFGLFRPRIMLPVGGLEKFSSEQLRFIFLHELAHIRRGDILRNWVATATVAVHWFNPLVWFGFARWRLDRELACDSMALEVAGHCEKGKYGETVLSMLETSRKLVNPYFAGIMEDREQLHERIKNIAHFAPRSRLAWVAGLFCACIAFTTLTDAAARARVGTKLIFEEPIVIRKPVDGGSEVTVHVVDELSGKPVQGADVRCPGSTVLELAAQKVIEVASWRTDAKGTARIRIGRDSLNTSVTLEVVHPSYVPRGMNWSGLDDQTESIPQELTFKLRKGTRAGGKVTDHTGSPLAGVQVRVFVSGTGARTIWREPLTNTFSEFDFVRTGLLDSEETDHRGNFSIPKLPNEIARVTIEFYRRDGGFHYLSYAAPSEKNFMDEGVPTFDLQELRNGNAKFSLPPGVTVSGSVTQPDGRAARNVLMTAATGVPARVQTFRTDRLGRFELGNQSSRQLLLTAYANDFAPTSVSLSLVKSVVNVALRLEPSRKPVINIADVHGKPLRGARVAFSQDEAMRTVFVATTDSAGRCVWTNAIRPAFSLRVTSADGTFSRRVVVPGEIGEFSVSLDPRMNEEIIVQGRVLDNVTLQPISAHTRLRLLVNRPSEEEPGVPELGSDFRFTIPRSKFATSRHGSYQLEIKADGYESLTTEPRWFGDGDWTEQFHLKPTLQTTVDILTPQGSPATSAELYLGNAREPLRMGDYQAPSIHPVRDAEGHPYRYKRVRGAGVEFNSDEHGKVNLQTTEGDVLVWTLHESGFVATTTSELKKTKRIQLLPWVTLTQEFFHSPRLAPDQGVFLESQGTASRGTWSVSITARADREGRFTFERVPPGEYLFARMVQVRPTKRSHDYGRPVKFSHQTRIQVIGQPGERTGVFLVGEAPQVTTSKEIRGRIPGFVAYAGDEQFLIFKTSETKPEPPLRTRFVNMQEYAKAHWQYQSELFAWRLKNERTYPLEFEEDGSFRVDAVPAGEYRLEIAVHDREPTREESESRPTIQWTEDPVATLSVDVSVPNKLGDPPTNLGVLQLKWKKAH